MVGEHCRSDASPALPHSGSHIDRSLKLLVVQLPLNFSAGRNSAAPRSCCTPYDRATLVVTATALLLATRAGPVKGSAWTVADNSERLCGNLTLCTASNLTWPVATVYDAVSGCALLKRKGLENLHFFGARPRVSYICKGVEPALL